MAPFLFVWIVAASAHIDPPLPVPPPAPPPIVTVPIYAPPPPPLPSAAHPRPAMPSGNPGDWVTSDDYPPAALREEASGTTGFRVQIDRSGNVSSCEIFSTSGNSLLDSTTCALINARARFVPATDPKGRPVEGTYSSRVRWVIPYDLYKPEPGVLVFSYIAELDGSVSNCRIERKEGVAYRVPDDSERLCPRRLSEPYRDEAGNPVRKVVRITSSVAVEDLPPADPVPGDR